MDFQEYNASKKDSVRRPFISLLPEDGIYKFLEENFTYAFEFEFARFASMYFLRDKRTRQSVNDLSNYSPKEPQSPLLPVRRQFFQTTVRTEVIIMLYMSDLPMKENPMSLLDELKSAVLLNDQILDNAYCFLMKQTSANMQENSEQRGWELINYLLSIKLPPPPLFAFVLYFICKTPFSSDVSVLLFFSRKSDG